MKIAIIGAGFAGLSSAWHLLKNPTTEVTLFDQNGIGGGASGIAAGLLHPFTGLHAKLNRFGMEGYQSTLELLEASREALGKEVSKPSKLLRLCLTKQQEIDYLKCSKLHRGVTWLDAIECQTLVPTLAPYSGILIENATTVYTDNYLQGLYLAIEKRGCKFEKQKIENLHQLQEFDHIVITAGADTKLFSELQNLDLFLVKGQILKLEWPMQIDPLKLPINSEKYILMDQDMRSCIAGSTFERNFLSPMKDLSFAKAQIMPNIIAALPCLENAKVIDCKAAIRVSTKNHLPIVQKITPRLSVFVGLGSKGLLYHAYFGAKLSHLIYKDLF